LLLVDDPHNEQDIINGNLDVFDKAYEWFTTGARTRLMPGGRVALVQTRWAKNDLTGKLTKDMTMNEGADQYEVIEFPAVLEKEETDENGDIQIVQKSLWPEQWPLEALLRTKASMPTFQWNAQYQQNPTSEEGAIIKREWWRVWQEERPPFCDFIIQAWDTAFEKNTRADYSACTTWGVWYPEKEPQDGTTGTANLILLDSFKDRMEFPELKKVALEHYHSWNLDSRPVSVIVEKKASGAPLIYELRAMGVPVGEFTPSKGNDKISRVNAVADIFASGMVWVPPTRWAEELMDEVAAFPVGEHDDLVDSMTLALMRFRQGGYIRTQMDEPEPKRYFKRRGQGYY
jgi:predicted phage terminase large subunit-like protein